MSNFFTEQKVGRSIVRKQFLGGLTTRVCAC